MGLTHFVFKKRIQPHNDRFVIIDVAAPKAEVDRVAIVKIYERGLIEDEKIICLAKALDSYRFGLGRSAFFQTQRIATDAKFQMGEIGARQDVLLCLIHRRIEKV